MGFLEQLREECFGLSIDVIGRYSLAADIRASSLGERFVALASRDVAEGLLQLTESAYLHFCHASRCGHCSAETASDIPTAIAAEVGLVDRLQVLTQRLVVLS